MAAYCAGLHAGQMGPVVQQWLQCIIRSSGCSWHTYFVRCTELDILVFFCNSFVDSSAANNGISVSFLCFPLILLLVFFHSYLSLISCDANKILWHVCWKPELWSQQRQPLLENGFVTRPLLGYGSIAVTDTHATIEELLEAVFSV
jgi:hypothetical protein